MNEAQILQSALSRTDPRERKAYLALACGADLALRQRIEQALQGTDPAIDPTLPGIDLVHSIPAAPLFPFLAPTTRPDSLGRLDHYEVLDLLGQGGMGVVLKAFDPNLDRFVALKVLPGETRQPATARQRFDRETRAIAAIEHENVVGIHAVFPDHDPPYFAMPFIPGPSLQDLLDRGAIFPVPEIVRIGRETATGLAAAHQRGVVHRDVKPSNILLEQPSGRVKITDFGLAKPCAFGGQDDVALTSDGLVAGTPLYMSPEQAHGLAVDGRSDLFSLGSVLYTLCTGRSPFEGNTPPVVLRRVCDDEPVPIRLLNPAIPEWLADIITRLLAKDPAHRFQSAQELADLLARMEGGKSKDEGGRMKDESETQRSGFILHPSSFILLLVSLFAAVLAGVLLVLFLPGVGQQGPPTSESRLLPPDPRLLSCPADALSWERIPRALRAPLGGGDPDKAPRALVAILADPVRRPRDVFCSAAYRPDGAVVAVGGYRGELWIVDAGTGALMAQFPQAHAEQIRALVYRCDGKRLASGGFDNVIRVWNPATMTAPLEIKTCGEVKGLVYSRDGKVLHAALENSEAGHRTEVWNWNADTGEALRHVTVSSEAPHALVIHPEGNLLAVAGYDHEVHLLDAKTLEQVRKFQGHTKPILGLAFSRHGNWLFSGGEDATIKGWNIVKGGLAGTLPAPDKVISVTSLGSATLVAACVDGPVPVYDLLAREELSRIEEPGESLRFVVSSPDTRTFLVGGWGGTLSFRDSATRQDRHPFAGHYGPVHGAAFSPDGRLLATCGQDRIIALWDTATAQPVGQLLGHPGPVGCVAFSPDGSLLASSSPDHSVRVWTVQSRRLLHQLGDNSASFISVCFSPDGSLLAASTLGGTVHVWNREGQPVQTWKASGQVILNLAFLTTGLAGADQSTNILATVSPEGGLRLWNPLTGEEDRILPGHEVATQALAVSPVGGYLAGAGTDGRIRLWDAKDALVREFPGPQGPVHTLAFRADGKLLVAYAPGEALVQWWDLASHQAGDSPASPLPKLRTRSLKVGTGRADLVYRLALSPEGRHVAVTSHDRAVYLLRLAAQGEEPSFDP
jgi:WD40 repeat protein/serine/threonine protein kinase